MRKDKLSVLSEEGNLDDYPVEDVVELSFFKKLGIFSVSIAIFLVILFVVVLLSNCRIVDSFDIDRYVWGDRLIKASNMPYEYLEYKITANKSLIVMRSYPVPKGPAKLGKSNNDLDEVIKFLTETTSMFTYVDGKKDPNTLEEEGGDCQAAAIWLASYLDGCGYDNGFLPLATHVVNWVKLDNTYYRVDAFGAGLSEASISDVRRIIGALGDK